ncbi:hypothetical protein [Streptomyces resistomycificus]|uniref:hypothetical protein n=1 Tax=Streptomyces resistomycificus TaxID=67356 RepID=UPI0018E2F352|nr:hypothetical protein [Streptomyces resistomycificus]
MRTRISYPVDRTAYGAAMRRHIRWKQLDVTEDEFWVRVRRANCLTEVPPSRHATRFPLAWYICSSATWGVDEDTVAGMIKDEAIARLQMYWADGGGAPTLTPVAWRNCGFVDHGDRWRHLPFG